MSEQNNDQPKKVATPEEKAAAAAEAKAAAEARRKAKEQAALEQAAQNNESADGGVAEDRTFGLNETTPDPEALRAETVQQPTDKRKPTPEEKAAAAAAAKAAAEARRAAKEAAQNEATNDTQATETEAPVKKQVTAEEKAAAAAAAKAAAEARRKAKEAEQAGGASSEPAAEKKQFTPEEKAAAAAAAKAAAEERRKAKEAAAQGAGEGASDDEKAIAAAKAKAAAAAKAKAAAAAKAKAAAGGEGTVASEQATEAAPKEPSKNQPKLDNIVKLITGHFGNEVLEESYINTNSKEDVTIVVKNDRWFEVASFLRNCPELAFDYLVNLMGVDYEEYMEVVYYLQSFTTSDTLMVKVKISRENASIASVSPIWAAANWNEREQYDLLGIQFTGHPNLVRIMLTDDWVGHPLRKDYQPFDKEV